MTIGELKNEVFALAGLGGADADTLFLSALRGSLATVCADLKITSSKRLRISKNLPFSYIPKLVHLSGETKSLPISGRAYSLRVSGKGCFTVRDGGSSVRYDFDTDDRLFRGFIRSGGEMEFSGDFYYCVYGISLYSETVGERVEDIPDGKNPRVIDFSAYEDFLAFFSPPKNDRGEPEERVSTDGSKLLIPCDFEGALNVRYLKLPREPNESDDSSVDLDGSYRPLLTSLLVSRMLTDCDSEQSERYARMYSEMLKKLKSAAVSSEAVSVRTNGWA